MRTNVKLPAKKVHPTSKTTSVFMSGNSQAVRLPEGFRFEGKESSYDETKSLVMSFCPQSQEAGITSLMLPLIMTLLNSKVSWKI